MNSQTPTHPRTGPTAVSRRGFLALAGTATALAAGGTAWSGEPAQAATAHPGLLHTAEDLARMTAQVQASRQPWIAGWEALTRSSHARATWEQRPTAVVTRGGDGTNAGLLYTDIHAAYQNALVWRVSGNEDNARKARDILNGWSHTLTEINGNADRYLAVGIYGYQFANAVELMRDYEGFDLDAAGSLLLSVFYPMNDRFLREHNDAHIENYWANWDLCNMTSILSIGALLDRGDLVDQAVTYFKAGGGNGSIGRAVPFLHENGTLGQWQESGRDQPHSIMGIGLMGAFCETAWNQGIDLYGYDDSRFAKAAEYVARYNLGYDVPYRSYSWRSGQGGGSWQTQAQISEAGRGEVRPVWAMIHGHYAGRRGMEMPYVTEMIERNGTEAGGGQYGVASGGYDQLGFGTLTFRRPRPAAKAAEAPAESAERKPGEAASASPSPSVSSSASPSASPSPSPSPSPSASPSPIDGTPGPSPVPSSADPSTATAAASDGDPDIPVAVPVGFGVASAGALLGLVGKFRGWFER